MRLIVVLVPRRGCGRRNQQNGADDARAVDRHVALALGGAAAGGLDVLVCGLVAPAAGSELGVGAVQELSECFEGVVRTYEADWQLRLLIHNGSTPMRGKGAARRRISLGSPVAMTAVS